MLSRPTLTVPQPCSESWAAMTPTAQGRHCAACNKVVVDFTCMTDAELLVFLRHQPATSCGRFTAQQLNRPLVAPQASAPWRRWLAAATLALGLGEVVTSSARAQTPHQIQQSQKAQNDSSLTGAHARAANCHPTTSSVQIRGRVLASDARVGLSGATIRINGTSLSTVTEADGSFVLVVPTSQLIGKRRMTLAYSSIGFATRRQRVRINTPSTVVAPLVLKSEPLILGKGAFLNPYPSKSIKLINRLGIVWETLIGLKIS